MTLKTPEYPDGRDIIVIANDITHLIGSFGIKEDTLFQVSFDFFHLISVFSLCEKTLIKWK